jgi:hypothetical protein
MQRLGIAVFFRPIVTSICALHMIHMMGIPSQFAIRTKHPDAGKQVRVSQRSISFLNLLACDSSPEDSMRLHLVIVVAMASLFVGSNALPASTDARALASEQNPVVSKRFLRTEEAAEAEADISTEERGPINVDIILEDAAKKATMAVRRATKWKAQFAWWKLKNKTPAQLSHEWGVAIMGRAMRQHKKWEKLEAYRAFYGNGPLRYP